MIAASAETVVTTLSERTKMVLRIKTSLPIALRYVEILSKSFLFTRLRLSRLLESPDTVILTFNDVLNRKIRSLVDDRWKIGIGYKQLI
jgi:hypothetical protein